jgi:hypothetical protein
MPPADPTDLTDLANQAPPAFETAGYYQPVLRDDLNLFSGCSKSEKHTNKRINIQRSAPNGPLRAA